MNKNTYTFLFSLLNTPTPSGYEKKGAQLFGQFCSYLYGAKHEFTDNIGNVAYSIGHGSIPFMISGHIDEIALQVQYIDDKGFIHFIKDGGVDPKTVIGREVIIHSNGNEVLGVIGKTPIHVEFHTEANDKVTKLKDLKIDIGAESKEDAEKLVAIGSPITFSHYAKRLQGERIVSGSIDDKVGVCVTAGVLERLSEYTKFHPLQKLVVYGVACTQEEVGGYGATIAAKRINPAYSIDYDVTFATDDGCVSPDEWGDIKLGKGGCIAFGPDKDLEMANDIIKVCNAESPYSPNRIPYQTFSVGAGMTNTLKIKLAADDCKTLLLSVPQRNMHTQVEVCDLRDIDSLINMTFNYIIWLDSQLCKNDTN
jgi:endoglucanase